MATIPLGGAIEYIISAGTMTPSTKFRSVKVIGYQIAVFVTPVVMFYEVYHSTILKLYLKYKVTNEVIKEEI